MKHLFYILLLLFSILTSCTEQEDYEVPQGTFPEPQISGNKTTIMALKNEFDYSSESMITYDGRNMYLEGYVVSSDKAGNFFKELVIQDAPTAPKAGIHVCIDQSGLFEQYEVGRKIYLQLDGLSMGLDRGVLKLGKLQENSITAISPFEVQKYIIRSPEIATITPRLVTLENLDNTTESQYLQIQNLQFARALITDIPKTYAGESDDQYDGERELFECQSQASILLSTSTYADFKSMILPATQGELHGLLTKNYSGDYYILKLNSHTDLNFDNSNRCDPEFLRCEDPDSAAESVLFEEDFNSTTKISHLEELGWTNINTNGDLERWENKKITNVDNRVMQISAYNSDLNPLEAWLITPPILSEHATDEQLSFSVRTAYNNGRALTVWLTNAFSGDPTTTSWYPLDIDLPYKSANTKYIANVPISCLEGQLHIGFKYKGRDPGITSTYVIDDIKITAKVTQ